MDKLEMKLTLTSDSTPELLRYLSGISSARDRAFILKRLATVGLSILGDGVGAHAMLLPSPAAALPTGNRPDVVEQQQATPSPPAEQKPAAPAAVPVAHPAPAPRPAEDEALSQRTPDNAAQPAGFDFLDLDALNAATAQFV
ncbi:hypothetical protein [Cupriavidus pampae]|uniref:Uncharacterized protein n=1 Tax=Cupriavidus pampae TaxID=659251 RepID=A0ABN7ZLX5_9BURK|nr:hypothetical protein [Cupriavidus pampae]CAG9186015.1 hypothetical protein LMG32289_06216 [Cupriavidus pampae]